MSCARPHSRLLKSSLQAKPSIFFKEPPFHSVHSNSLPRKPCKCEALMTTGFVMTWQLCIHLERNEESFMNGALCLSPITLKSHPNLPWALSKLDRFARLYDSNYHKLEQQSNHTQRPMQILMALSHHQDYSGKWREALAERCTTNSHFPEKINCKKGNTLNKCAWATNPLKAGFGNKKPPTIMCPYIAGNC